MGPSRMGGVVSLVMFLMSYTGFIVAFGSPHWAEHMDQNLGLWKKCRNNNKLCIDMIHEDLPGGITAALVLQCLALVAGAAALGGYVWWLARSSLRGSIVAWSCCLSAAVLSSLGLICWGHNVDLFYNPAKLGWAFWLSVSSTILMMITAASTGISTGCGALRTNMSQYKAASIYGGPRPMSIGAVPPPTSRGVSNGYTPRHMYGVPEAESSRDYIDYRGEQDLAMAALHREQLNHSQGGYSGSDTSFQQHGRRF